MQRLVSHSVSDLTPGIWSHVRLKKFKESRRRRSSKRNICFVWTPINSLSGSLMNKHDSRFQESSLTQFQIPDPAIKG
ncbi:hypothetical protein J6590_031923, partial [Homalodisca vitripennis]